MAQQKVENWSTCHAMPPEAFYKHTLKFRFCFQAPLPGRFCATRRGDWRGHGLDSSPGCHRGPWLCQLGYSLLMQAICQRPLTPEFSLLRCPNMQGIWACLYQPCSCQSPACRAIHVVWAGNWLNDLTTFPSRLTSGRVGHTPCPSPLPPGREGQAACPRLC